MELLSQQRITWDECLQKTRSSKPSSGTCRTGGQVRDLALCSSSSLPMSLWSLYHYHLLQDNLLTFMSHILKSSPLLPSKSPYQNLKKRKNWGKEIKEIMGRRVATLYNPRRPPRTSQSWGMVPSVLNSVKPAHEVLVVLVRPDAGQMRVFNTCSEGRKERLVSKSQGNNTNNHNQLPGNVFKFNINLFAGLS